MLAALPLIGVALVSIGIAASFPSLGLRAAFLSASVLLALFAYALAELLGAFGALIAPAVCVAWLGVVIVAAIALRRRRFDWTKFTRARDTGIAALVLPVIALLAITALLALLGPPNTYDGLLYHLPRVMHWRQDASLAFYPSHVLPQLHHPPLAEVMMLHTVLLSGTDALVNMVSWWFYVGCIVGVSVIARHLAGNGAVQALAALLAATIPVAVLQASGPKNDLALAFWLVCLTWVLVRGIDRLSVAAVFLAGVSLGLALATKGSAALFAAPIVGTFFLVQLVRRKRSIGRTIGSYLVIGLLGLGIAAPHALRNVNLYGSVLGAPYDGPTEAFAYQSRTIDPPRVASAIVKNVGSQLGTPWESVNQLTDASVRAWHQWTNVSVDDPAITWGNRTFYVVAMHSLQEESAPNPLSIVLICVALLVAAASCRQLSVAARCMVITLPLTFILYSALIKWQPATNRFQLPLLILWCPLIAALVSGMSRRSIPPLAVLAVVGAMPAVFDNRWRPLTGDLNVFTGDRAMLALGLQASRKDALEQAARTINQAGCKRVGLELQWDQLEYPWRRLLPDARIEHINVRNVSARLPYPIDEPLAPCAAVSLGAGAVERLVVDGVTLEAVATDETATVYLTEGQSPPVRLRYSAQYSLSMPNVWQPDSSQRYEVTLVNTGTETWSTDPGYILSASFGRESDEPNEPWETERQVKLPTDVAPGEGITVDVELQAPSRPGTYIVRHRLARDGSPTFGQLDRREVTVGSPNRRR